MAKKREDRHVKGKIKEARRGVKKTRRFLLLMIVLVVGMVV